MRIFSMPYGARAVWRLFASVVCSGVGSREAWGWDMDLRDRTIDTVQRTLGWGYRELTWLSPWRVEEANRERDSLLDTLPSPGRISCHGLKPHHGPLSPGCLTCAAGTWSCLFVNRVCNAPCFYCPIDKRIKGDEPPNAAGLVFENPTAYVEYLERFGYTGVGISGGEPLLALSKVLDFVRAIRARFGKDIYVWMYSNGILANAARLDALAEAGIDEIRFDLSANDYHLAAVELAAGRIPCVTVEIPMIPEDEDRLIALLPELERLGVAHLNLHPLTANDVSYDRFVGRPYTFLHQPAFAVLESELAALRVLHHAASHHPGLPLQICTRPYKKQVQGSGRRLRALQAVGSNWLGTDSPTETGYLRRLTHPGEPPAPRRSRRKMKLSDQQGSAASPVLSTPVLTPHLRLAYFDPIVSDRPTGIDGEAEVVLAGQKRVYVRRELAYDFGELSPAEAELLEELVFGEWPTQEAEARIVRHREQAHSGNGITLDEPSRMELILHYERMQERMPEMY